MIYFPIYFYSGRWWMMMIYFPALSRALQGPHPGALQGAPRGACRSSRENPQRAFESARTSEVDHNATPPGGRKAAGKSKTAGKSHKWYKMLQHVPNILFVSPYCGVHTSRLSWLFTSCHLFGDKLWAISSRANQSKKRCSAKLWLLSGL